MMYNNVWGSVTVFTKAIIADLKTTYGTGVPIEYFDWDAHANAHELPNADLVGPLAIAITQNSPEIYSINFSIGVSTYATDKNLFRQRDYISRIFDKMQSRMTIPYYEANTASHISEIVMVNGTMVSPMSKAEIRPWQYVQGDSLLLPVGSTLDHLAP